MKKIYVIVSVFCIALAFSCTENKATFEVISFDPISNKDIQQNDSLITLSADLSNAALYGITIPSSNQSKEESFIFSFKLKNKGHVPQRLFYKIYYQNQSYKFPEGHELSNENFYGTWEDLSVGFKPIEDFEKEIEITDSVRIIGNPRDEKIFYGSNPADFLVNDSIIELKKQAIRNSPDWIKQIEDKAKQQKVSTEEQLHLDALWAVDFDRNADKSFNNRWKRNPRMGKYEFLLVVVTEEDLHKIPREVKLIGTTNSDYTFVNPFSYFIAGEGKKLNNSVILISNKKLKVNAKFDLGAGIFISRTDVNKSNYKTDFFSNRCGDNPRLYYKAQFQQYFHYINRDFPLRNIPEIRDVVGENISREEYARLKAKYESNKQFVNTFVNSSDCPCKTVVSDSITNSITVINPGNNDGEYKKEHVGIAGRIGFTYGKWRAKIKFPELINKNNVWNGLTNAFWLLAQQGDADWNMRRSCNAEIAYIPKSEGDNEAALWKSRKQIGYSEIDFEILKESQYWPSTSYKNSNDYKKEDAASLDDITVTCTNWDMACHEPKLFNIGAVEHDMNGFKYMHHRWNPWYKALTTKVAAKNKEVFGGNYYYFEIEWRPDCIIWKIGPAKDKLKTICIMDNTVSAIPNNQMAAMITQEWHSQEWWPTAPFKQNFVPFPKKDIVGKILEIEVE